MLFLNRSNTDCFRDYRTASFQPSLPQKGRVAKEMRHALFARYFSDKLGAQSLRITPLAQGGSCFYSRFAVRTYESRSSKQVFASEKLAFHRQLYYTIMLR